MGRTAAECRASEPSGIIGDQAYRLVVYRSSSLDQRKARRLDRVLSQLRADADRAAGTFAREDFPCAAEAEAAATAVRAQAPRWWPGTTTVHA